MKNNNHDGRHRIKQMIICISLAVFFIGAVIPAGLGHAERRVKGEWTLPKHYPNGFHGYGILDRLAADEVVIDDSILRLSRFATYATPNSEIASRSSFKSGDLVGYLKNSENEVQSLWLIKRSDQ